MAGQTHRPSRHCSMPGAHKTGLPNALNQLLFPRLREKWLQIPRANQHSFQPLAPSWIYFSLFCLHHMMHIRLSQETLEPVCVGREIPLLLALAELLEQHNRAQLLLCCGQAGCTAHQRPAEAGRGVPMQAPKPKATTAGSRNNRKDKVWWLTLKPEL